VGHGRVLGRYAAAQQQQFFPKARRVHFVHTDAEQLEAAKEEPGGGSNMINADARRNLERDLARSADLVVGVGPLLTGTILSTAREN
jgi:D-inositol-3-phosphate glycosyltransferase